MDLKDALKRYLAEQRESLIFKTKALGERDLRLPRTPTGTSLIGMIKHCLNVEYGYFGPTFGRTIDDPTGLVPFEVYDEDPQADWYATETETSAGLIDLYKRVQAFCDVTIDELPLDAVGRVPWWGEREVTLGQIMVHVIQELARHAGQADILRELTDGSAGMRPGDTDMPDYDWSAYVTKLNALADSYPR